MRIFGLHVHVSRRDPFAAGLELGRRIERALWTDHRRVRRSAPAAPHLRLVVDDGEAPEDEKAATG